MIVVRSPAASSTTLDPLLLGPMSVRELATVAAERLGLRESSWTLADPAGVVLDPEAIAPRSGFYDLVEIGGAV